MTARIPCSVPFCRRTAPRIGKFLHCTEIICGKHWRLADRPRRLLHSRLMWECDRDRRSFWHMPPGSPERIRRIKVERVRAALWARIKGQAIERAAGIS